MIGEAGRSVKEIASDLRPAALNLGLSAAVEWLAARVLGKPGWNALCDAAVREATDQGVKDRIELLR